MAETDAAVAEAEAVVATEPVAITAARVDASLLPVADALARWMALALERAGGEPGLSDALRQARGPLVPDLESTSDILERAGRVEASRVLLVDLEELEAAILLSVRAYDTRKKSLLGAATRSTRPDQLGDAATEALDALLPRIGLATSGQRSVEALKVDHLATQGRALRALDAGELTRAWRELSDQRSEASEALRAAILRAAASKRTSVSERARLLAARGEPDRAWVLLSTQSKPRLDSPTPPPELLLAAADVQFARGRSTDANRYYERSLAADPELLDAHLGIAQVQKVQKRTEQARRSLERAAELDPQSPRPVELLAALDARDPERRAEALMRAGRRHAAGLATETATVRFATAVRLDATVEADAHDEAGRMSLRLGNVRAAEQNHARAIELGGESAVRLRALGQARRLQGDLEAARESLERAVELDPNDAAGHRELGVVYEHAGRTNDAIVSLRRAMSLAGDDAGARSKLARALRDAGKEQEALELLQTDLAGAPLSTADLLLIAQILRGRGQTDAAVGAIDKAVELRPADPQLRLYLAQLHAEAGRTDEAEALRDLAVALGGDRDGALDPSLELAVERQTSAPDPLDMASTTELIPLVATFGARRHDAPTRVAFLGVREYLDVPGTLLDWLSPTTPDLASLDAEIAAAISTQYELVSEVEIESFAASAADDVRKFQSAAALSPRSIAAVNLSLGTDAVFVAQLVRAPGGPAGHESSCGEPPYFEIELRRLTGYSADDVQALANVACLPDGLEARGQWNQKAAGVYGGLLLLLLVLCRRGWGSVIVGLKLPPNTKALFSVSLSRRPRRVKSHGTGKLPSGRASGRIERSLRSLDLRERRLRERQPTIFRWVSARSRPYYLTVRGPLLDYLSDELVGDFLEEKTVLVKRGERVRVEFDMRPQECALHVSVNDDGSPLAQAVVAVRGDRSSVRYCSNGSAFLYLAEGTHTIVAGSGDRVAERSMLIEDLEAKALPIDLSAEHGLLFSGCPDAVVPYVEGNFEAAAEALEAAGRHEVAELTRALGLDDRGDVEGAARSLAAAGRPSEAAERMLQAKQPAAAAELFEAAADYRRAGDCRRSAGELAEAARLYALDHAYDEAVECLREVGDKPALLELLEMSGSCFEAAEIAEELGDADRAMANLQRVDPQLDCYVQACLKLGSLYAARGEEEGALERYDEAMRLGGAEEIPATALRQHAELLERAGRLQDAVTMYERVRIDGTGEDATARIETLRKKIQTEGPVVVGVATQTQAASGTAAATGTTPSRYEILEELGRGGMGVVYKARDTHLGRIVALKQLTDNLRQHPTAVHYFEREARSAAALNHPNIVTVYDAGTENDSYFISMEFLEGTPLDAILEARGALPARTVARLGLHVATGLQYAHRNKIIHRDIKTANLFFTQDKIVKIMDFGLAKMVEEVRRASTIIAGTPYYMSPEQSSGDNPDHRADLYSLGVTMFQLLTGRVPFTDGDVTYHHRHTAAPDPREIAPDAPEPLARLVLQMLEKEREDRIQSAAEIAEALQRMLG